MAGHTHIYHWKHGWIPLDHEAALSKAHGSQRGARSALAGSFAAGHAHESVIGGTFDHLGGTPERGLKPVALEHLPRERHIIAAWGEGTRRFALHDPHGRHEYESGPVTTSIPEHLAEHFHTKNYKIKKLVKASDGDRVLIEDQDKNIKLFRADGSDITTVDPHRDSNGRPTPVTPANPHGTHTFKPITVQDALGPDNRTEGERAREGFRLKYGGNSDVSLRDRIAAKVKQAYRDEHGHTVLIEPSMTKAQTQELLNSVHHVTRAAGDNLPGPIRFHVPSGASHFHSGTVLGYVVRGTPTVHLSPKLAAGLAEQPKGAGHFMPAHDTTSTLRYATAHEVGHVVDGANGHYHEQDSTPSGMSVPAAARLHRDHRSDLSGYGQNNPAEAYAEAFAQWVIDKGKNDPVARAYAERFGWK